MDMERLDMMNKWNNRPQSPSAIPRLLQNRPITSSCDSSRSPSPVKTVNGSKIPTFHHKRTSSISSTPEIKEYGIIIEELPDEDKLFDFQSSENIGEQLEEIDFFDDESNADDNSGIWLTGRTNSTNEYKPKPTDTTEHEAFNDQAKLTDTMLENKYLSSSSPKQQERFAANSKSMENLNYVENISPKWKSSKRKSISLEQISPLPNYPSVNNENVTTKDRNRVDIMIRDNYSLVTNVSRGPSNQEHVIYITKKLLTKLSKKDDLLKVTELNMTLSSRWQGKIQYIENLDLVRNLKSLSLAQNSICKAQNLSPLTRLQSLDLSSNQLRSLEGLDSLTLLENLNVNENMIKFIPNWLSKKLSRLKCFQMANNQIQSLTETEKLSTLSDLIDFDILGNPVCELKHSRLKIVSQLCSLHILNKEEVTDSERKHAAERFSQDEINLKQQQLKEQTAQIQQLQAHNESLQKEKEDWTANEKKLSEKLTSLKKSVKAKNEEIESKDSLLAQQKTELSKACEKQFKVEQELAFYKLDSKFADFLLPRNSSNNMVDEAVNLDESAYIGKATYARNLNADETIILSNEQASTMMSFLTKLDRDELNKHGKLLAIIKDLAVDNKIDSNDELKQLKRKAANLKKTISSLESEVETCQLTLTQKENEIDSINLQLQEMDETNPLFGKLSATLHHTEKEYESLKEKINGLHVELDEANNSLINTYQQIKDAEKHLDSNGMLDNQQLKSTKMELEETKAKISSLVDENSKLKKINGDILNELHVMRKNNDNVSADQKKWKEHLDKENNAKNLLKSENSNLKTLLKSEAKKIEKLSKALTGKENDSNDKIEEQKDLIKKLSDDTKQSKRAIDIKDQEKSSILHFIKGLTSDVLHHTALRNVKNVMHQDTVAVLQKHRNVLAEELSYNQNEEIDGLKHENDHLQHLLQECQHDLSDAQQEINELKHDVDLHESNERILKHQVEAFKDDMKERDEKHLSTLSEYDQISSEMRDQIEVMDHKIEMLSHENNKLHDALSQENDSKNNLEKQLDSLKNGMKQKLDTLYENEKKLKADNKALQNTTEQMAPEMERLKLVAEKIKTEAEDMLQRKDRENKEILNNLFKELQMTKKFIAKLQDQNEKKRASELNQTKEIMDSIKALRDDLYHLGDHDKSFDIIFDELKDIRSSVKKLQKGIDHGNTTNVMYDKILKRLDGLQKKEKGTSQNVDVKNQVCYGLVKGEEYLSSVVSLLSILNNLLQAVKNEEESNDDNKMRSMDDSVELCLSKAVDQEKGTSQDVDVKNQIESLQHALTMKENELEKSTVPKNLVDFQRKEISQLKQLLQQKQAELLDVTRNPNENLGNQLSQPNDTFGIQNNLTSYDSDRKKDLHHTIMTSTPFHSAVNQHFQKHVTHHEKDDKNIEHSNIFYHEHYLRDDVDNDLLNHTTKTTTTKEENINDKTAADLSYCNIDEHEDLVGRLDVLENTILEGKMKKLSKGRDDLRWELSRLEAKIGDAALQRSFSRKYNRTPANIH